MAAVVSPDPRVVLGHYGVAVPFPTAWPAEKDDDDGSDDDLKARNKPLPERPVKKDNRKSRYGVLERNFRDRRSIVPGAEKTQDGVENLVHRDEPDALGFNDSVVRELKLRGLGVEEDERLRNRFLLSSTTFNPALYLSQVHANAGIQDLMQGLDFLAVSIDQKAASLKILVESNFERFVKAKSVIDNVYIEMRNQGQDPEVEEQRSRPGARHLSRSSLHFRNTSTSRSPHPGAPRTVNERKKHALTKESEYGVLGVKTPLIEVAIRAEEVWGPTLGGRERENNLRAILESIESAQDTLELGSSVGDCIKRKDYNGLVVNYRSAREAVDAARSLTEYAAHSKQDLSDAQIHQIVVTARMWLDVENQLEAFKRTIWRDLTSVEANLTMSTDRSHQEDHMALISVLLELGVEDNPIWVWLLSRYDYLKSKINTTFERSRMEIEIFRRRLAQEERPDLYTSAIHFKSPSRPTPEEQIKHLDSDAIMELWELIVHALANLLAVQGGVLGEVLDFWNKAQSFIDGKAQRMLPDGINGVSKSHHRLSSDGIKDLQNGAVELIDILRQHVYTFFADAPIEDVSTLFSPPPADSPRTPRSTGPNPPSNLSPFARPEVRFNLDLSNPPPPSPKRGDSWEDFAFWPPYANSLSGVHFLSKIMLLIATAANEMIAVQPVRMTNSSADKLKLLISTARERSARAVCAAWNEDAQACKVLEDWTRGPDDRDVTRMPAYLKAFGSHVLSGLQKILYVPEAAATTKRYAPELVTPPPNKLLQMARSQFVTSLYKALSGMVENAEKPINVTKNPWVLSRDAAPMPQRAPTSSTHASRDVIDASTRNLRMLLTLSNLARLRDRIIPSLLAQFESGFSTKLSTESQTVHEVLTQIDTRLFQSYVRPPAEFLSATVAAGLGPQAVWPPTSAQPRPTSVCIYVHTALLHLVAVHTEVRTTSPPLVSLVLGHLFEHLVTALLQAFKARKSYDLRALMQATLDVEFVVQTLSPQYATARASERQSEIYAALDQAAEPGVRAKLQTELPEMRGVLKRLREGTRGEFACFRKDKHQHRQRST